MRRGRVLVGSVLAVVVGAVVVGQPPVAVADPVSSQVVSAKAQVQRLQDEASQAGEDYDQARIALAGAQAKVKAMTKQISDQQAKVDKLTQQAGTILLTQFQGRGVGTTLALFTSSNPDSFLTTLSTTSKMDEVMNATLQQQQLEQARLVELKRNLTSQVASLSAAKQKAADDKAQINQKVADQQAVVSRLTAQQQAALARAMAAPKVTVSPATLASLDHAATAAPSPTPSTPSSVAASSSGMSPSAAKAVQYALSKVGDPYVWAASGPNAFDCSGLAMAAYASVGVSLPHSSAMMAHVGRPVSRSDLQPGDLLLWYSPVHHVSIYIGGGKMVHAARPGEGVRIDNISNFGAPLVGIRRVLG